MQTSNACSCPRCHFFLGYSATQPTFNRRRTTLIGACLNCDYRLPIRAILRGKRSRLTPPQRAASNLALVTGSSIAADQVKQAYAGTVPRYCARELRAVGQALEQLHVKSFNLRRAGQSYLIWERESAARAAMSPLSDRPVSTAPRYRFSRTDIERIERAGISQRSQYFHPVNGHKLSHLLRTLGAQIERRGQRLLGLTWHDQAVSVILQSPRGKRHVEEIRTEILYDLWVRMYLRRAR